MTAKCIDGACMARELRDDVADELNDLRDDAIDVSLATVRVGENLGAIAYERRLRQLADELDVPLRAEVLSPAASTTEVLSLIDQLNRDAAVNGILVLRPLPDQVDETRVFRALAPVKDIEAVHPTNAGLLALGTPRYVPSTAASIYHVLDRWLDEAGEDRADFYHRSLIVVVAAPTTSGSPRSRSRSSAGRQSPPSTSGPAATDGWAGTRDAPTC
jgi:methylenetetrahydrofolate dehydrogenase (NADP+) / methenyltetrahydrofolate cyclohydrolase